MSNTYQERISQLLIEIFKFFSSVKLAIILLFTLAAILAAGTFIESSYGADAAKILIYQTTWFSLVLVILGINVFSATLTRLPWKPKHIGFLITHLGILMILTGSLMTQRHGVDGVLSLEEGEQGNRIVLQEPLIYFSAPTWSIDETFPIQPHAFVWTGNKKIYDSQNNEIRLDLLRFLPKAIPKETIQAADTGPAALLITLKGAFINSEHWLMLDEPGSGTVDLGMAEITFSQTPISETALDSEQSEQVTFIFGDKTIDVPAASALRHSIPIEGTPYAVEIINVFQDARVENGELVEHSDQPRNPALQMVVTGPDLEEYHTVFANFPEFPTLHGLKESQTGAKILYRVQAKPPDKLQLRFIPSSNEEELPWVQSISGKQVRETHGIQFQQSYPTGWNDIEFTVETYFPHAVAQRRFEALPPTSKLESATSAIELQLTIQNQPILFWLGNGQQQRLSFSETPIHVAFGQRTLPMDFDLKLKDFKITYNPGTQTPASFESDVVLLDPDKQIERDINISMNEPLDYQGYKIYQSGYQLAQEPGEKDISVFSVGNDPGIPLKYSGSIVLILGTVIFFFTKKFSTSRPLDSKRDD